MYWKVRTGIINIWNDSLHRNSFFLMASTGVMAIIGFAFWILASKFYSPHDIGLGSSLISISTLLIVLSTLGLPPTIIRFINASKDPHKHISTALILSAATAIIISCIFWLASKFLFPELHTLIRIPITWIVFTAALIFGAWQQIIDSLFIAYKSTHWIFLESCLYSVSKIITLILITSLMGFGVFLSNTVGIGMAVIFCFSILFLHFRIKLKPQINLDVIRDMGKYSAASYVGNLFGMIPNQILPALITTSLGPTSAGHFFLALMMVNLLSVIPSASGQTLFSEGSSNPQLLRQLTIKSLRFQLILVLLGVIILWIAGGWLLSWFGSNYSEEVTPVLRILSIGVFSIVLSAPLVTRLRIRRNLKTLNLLTVASAFAILILSRIGSIYGLVGLTYGFVAGQFVGAIFTSTHYILETQAVWKLNKTVENI